MQPWEVILQNVCPGPGASSCMSTASLEQFASSLLSADKAQGIITRNSDVIKALTAWNSCFDKLVTDLEFQAETASGVTSTYLTVICGLPRVLPCPEKSSSRAIVDRFAQAITSGVAACIKLVTQSPPSTLRGSKLRYISEAAEVTRAFAEDFCDLWKAELGKTLISKILDAIVDSKPRLNTGFDVTAAMHQTGVMSFCSGLLCHLVTRCQVNQKLVQKHKRFNDVMRDVLPSIPALDVQLEILEVLFRVYRSSKTMPMSQFEYMGLTVVKEKLDSLVAAKGQNLNLTQKLVDIAVTYNAYVSEQSLCRTGFFMGPITVLPVTKAYLKSKVAATAVSEGFDSVAVSRSNITLMMKCELGDGAQEDWIVIPTSAVTDIAISAVTGSRAKLVAISATIPTAFNRNIVTQELSGAMKQDRFDAVLCLEMMPATAWKLKGVVQPLPDTDGDQNHAGISQACARTVLARPSAEVSDGHRRLSVTTVPVYQPLTLQPLGKSSHNQPGGAVASPALKSASLPGEAALENVPSPDLSRDNHVTYVEAAEEAATGKNALTSCDNGTAAAANAGKDVPKQTNASAHGTVEQCATPIGDNLMRAKGVIAGHTLVRTTVANRRESDDNRPVPHHPSKNPQEPLFNRRRRRQQADNVVVGQSMQRCETRNVETVQAAVEKFVVNVPPIIFERKPKRTANAHCHRKAGTCGKLQMLEKANLSSFRDQHLTPASSNGINAHQSDSHPHTMCTGRPKRRAAQRQVDYRDDIDEGSAEEVSDPISDTTFPIPHAQATRKKPANSSKACSQKAIGETSDFEGDRRIKKQNTPCVSIPEVHEIEKSSREKAVERVISETQSDDLVLSKSQQKIIGGNVTKNKQDRSYTGNARVDESPAGDKEASARPPSSRQQLRYKPVRHIAGVSNIFPRMDARDEFPPVHGNAVVPSPLTSHNPLTSEWKARDDLAPPGRSFEFDRQEQLQIPGLAVSLCPRPAKACGPTFMQDVTNLKMKSQSIIETNIQLNKLQPSANPSSCFQARLHRTQPKLKHVYQSSKLLPRAKTVNQQAKNQAKGPEAGASQNPVKLAKRRRNDIDRHVDDASQQAKEQQVMVMRMMHAMMQNEDDDDDQNMVQLQAAMSKLMKTKEQRKMQQKNKAIQDSRQKLQDLLTNAVDQYTQEEAHLEQRIASKLADSTQKMSDLWQIMSDMHSQHLAALACKWQQYQALGQKLNEDHHLSLEKMADMKARWSGTLTSLMQQAEVEMQQLEADLSKAKKRSRRQDPASMQKLLSVLMQ